MTSEGHVLLIKQHRRILDDALQSLKKLPPGRETSLAITNLQQAIMWLGMQLKELAGGQSCYEHGYDATPAVDPTSDGLKL
jgi:hypothetical protein